MSELKIFEGEGNDICDIYAHLNTPVRYFPDSETNFNMKSVDHFSEMNNQFRRVDRIDFINKLDAANPGKYSHFVIKYWDSN